MTEAHGTAVQQISKASRHLLSLINDLLDISSIEAGGADLAIETLDVNALVAETSELTRPIVAAAGMELDVVISSDQTAAMGDKRGVLQVLLNLVTNAAKYAEAGCRVTIHVTSLEEAVSIAVEDDGPGIAAADVPRLFRAFDRLGQQDRTRVEGTGLGLALSKSLVEAMGGSISYEDNAPGARFVVVLPLATARGGGAK